jgi:hypothetical protein
MTTHGETLSQAAVEPPKPLTEEYQPPNLTGRDDIDDIPDQQGWWDDADVRTHRSSSFSSFSLQLRLADSDHDNDEVIPPMAGSDTGPSSDEQPKPGQPPSTEG